MNVTAPLSIIPAKVGILAGMGPAAGVDFARLFLQSCEQWLHANGHVVKDQAFPEHWMAQVPVADRTQALADAEAAQPLEDMTRVLEQFTGLGICAAAISCNTAHAWHDQLQARVSGIELLHIARETALELRRRGVQRAALLATQGTYRMGLYDAVLQEQGIECVLPNAQEREWLMQGIYKGVKAGCMDLAQACFGKVARQIHERHPGAVMLMACTEIPLALPQVAGAHEWSLVDPSAILAMALARKAFEHP